MNTVTLHIRRFFTIILICLLPGISQAEAQTSKSAQRQKPSTSQSTGAAKKKSTTQRANAPAAKKGAQASAQGTPAGKKAAPASGNTTKKGSGQSGNGTSSKKKGAAQQGQKAAGKKQANGAAPTSQSLQKEQSNVKAEIAKTQKQIEQNKQSTMMQLNSLDQLKGEITTTTNNINNLTREVHTIEGQEKMTSDSIAKLENKVDKLKKESASSLRDNRKNRRSMSSLYMIFSAPTFYHALKRSGRIHQANERAAQLEHELIETIGQLSAQKQQLSDLRALHSIKLDDLSKENANLHNKQRETQTIVANLKKEGSALQQALLEKKKRAKALDDEITRLIAEEKRQAEEARKREEARKKEEARRKEEARKAEEARRKQEQQKEGPAKGSAAPARNDDKSAERTEKPLQEAASATAKLTGTFASNKGRLLFPVAGKYNIVSYFGRNQHEELPNVEIDNSGIDILTHQGASARAVFDGVVSMIVNLGGSHNVVMLRHGDYITVYSNIKTAAVKKGQSVKAGQDIGTVYTDAADNNRTILHFEVRKETQKLNPLQWVKR